MGWIPGTPDSICPSVNRTAARYPERMCRNIRPLFNFEPPTTESEMRDAALQYVRKVSGYTRPSQGNSAAFDRAVEEITAATRTLLASLMTTAPARDRQREAAKARARWERRGLERRRDG